VIVALRWGCSWWPALGGLAAFGMAPRRYGIAHCSYTARTPPRARPALLRDVGWGGLQQRQPVQGAVQAGSAASDLLTAAGTRLQRRSGRATGDPRDIRAVPCQERVTVNWQADQRGNLIDANAVLSPRPGCLPAASLVKVHMCR